MEEQKITFYDRAGKVRVPPSGAVVRARKGVWTLARTKDSTLLLWRGKKTRVLDLPGGGVDEGETLTQAAAREWQEEVGFDFSPSTEMLGSHHQTRGVFSETWNEYWIYDQTFFLYGYEVLKTSGVEWTNGEGDLVGWKRLDMLDKLPICPFHWEAMKILVPELQGIEK